MSADQHRPEKFAGHSTTSMLPPTLRSSSTKRIKALHLFSAYLPMRLGG